MSAREELVAKVGALLDAVRDGDANDAGAALSDLRAAYESALAAEREPGPVAEGAATTAAVERQRQVWTKMAQAQRDVATRMEKPTRYWRGYVQSLDDLMETINDTPLEASRAHDDSRRQAL